MEGRKPCGPSQLPVYKKSAFILSVWVTNISKRTKAWHQRPNETVLFKSLPPSKGFGYLGTYHFIEAASNDTLAPPSVVYVASHYKRQLLSPHDF